MLSDRDFKIREIGAETLDRIGAAPDDASLEKALTQSKPRGLLSLSFFAQRDPSEKQHWEAFQFKRLCQLSFEELSSRAQSAGVLDRQTHAALNLTYTKMLA